MDKSACLIKLCRLTGATLLLATSPWLLAKDPTQPRVTQPISQTSPSNQVEPARQQLEAIFLRKNNSFAVLNGKRFKQNDYFQGKQIVKIESNRIWLKDNEQISQLNLIPTIKSH